ncbi:MAG TPA: ACP S-malonyltransferase [Terriglobia bacterium]|nr:ACP S-malonyltransferase [Terriglobia bacterium]
MKTAFVFPGQGSQYPGMGRDICEQHETARRVFQEADDALGFSLSQLCFEGPEESLKLTENTQPAILTVSVALWRVLEERGVRPDYVAGHSLGEYSALVAAGGVRFADAVRLVRRRGRYMQEAVPVGVGAMAAILGLDLAAVDSVCASAAAGDIVRPANLNSPTQVVIAGHTGAVERAVALAKEAGAKRAIMLAVSAPFHCELLEPAAARLAVDLDAIELGNLRCPLVTNVDAQPITDAVAARDGLKRQVARPVRWSESVRRMLDDGAGTFVEIGPGKVLTGLIRAMDKTARTFNVEDEKSLENALNGLL